MICDGSIALHMHVITSVVFLWAEINTKSL